MNVTKERRWTDREVKGEQRTNARVRHCVGASRIARRRWSAGAEVTARTSQSHVEACRGEVGLRYGAVFGHGVRRRARECCRGGKGEENENAAGVEKVKI